MLLHGEELLFLLRPKLVPRPQRREALLPLLLRPWKESRGRHKRAEDNWDVANDELSAIIPHFSNMITKFFCWNKGNWSGLYLRI